MKFNGRRIIYPDILLNYLEIFIEYMGMISMYLKTGKLEQGEWNDAE